jgi:drug/metabolite transporter, DME family
LYLGVFVTGLAYLLYGWGLRSIGTSTAVTLTLAEPVTAAIFAVLILDERLEWFGWLGAGVVVVGLVVASQRSNTVGPWHE